MHMAPHAAPILVLIAATEWCPLSWRTWSEVEPTDDDSSGDVMADTR